MSASANRPENPMTESPTRPEILTAISTRLAVCFPPDVVERVLAIVDGTLAELDALPPYPNDTPFQAQLSCRVYPFLAAAQALDMEGQPTEVIEELVLEMFPQSAELQPLTW